MLFGDPAKTGFYSVLLFVPAHVTIEAHAHRDNRVATVVSGQWRFGYGDHFDVKRLKTLPPGSVYSEPGGVEHFAQTTDTAVVVRWRDRLVALAAETHPKPDPHLHRETKPHFFAEACRASLRPKKS